MQDGWADSRGQFVATDEGKLDARSAGRLCMRTGRAVRRPLYHKSKSGICPPRLVHCQSRPEQPRPSSAAPCACWLFVRCGSACFDGETGPQQRHQRPALQLRALRDEHRREQAKAAISSSAVTQKVTPGRGAAERGSGGAWWTTHGPISSLVHHGPPRWSTAPVLAAVLAAPGRSWPDRSYPSTIWSRRAKVVARKRHRVHAHIVLHGALARLHAGRARRRRGLHAGDTHP